jgi:hypothetical protein
MSDSTLLQELIHTAKLDNIHRGQLAELAFMRKAANIGFSVAKPWGEADRYDVIIRKQTTFYRVQVKSVLGKAANRNQYPIRLAGSHTLPYSTKQIDFLVAYIFPENLWYIFPATIVANRRRISVTPGFKKSRYEAYREAWHLIEPPTPESEPGSVSIASGTGHNSAPVALASASAEAAAAVVT